MANGPPNRESLSPQEQVARMKRYHFSAFRLTLLALMQIAAAVTLLSWALPLSDNRPILGNGVDHGARLIEEAAKHSADPQQLAAMAGHLRRLYRQAEDGVLAAIGAAGVLLLGAAIAISAVIANFRDIRQLSLND